MLKNKITRSLTPSPWLSGHPCLLRVLLLAFLVLPFGVSAGVYKWTDEAGNVHYSSQRPDDAVAEKLKIDTRTTPRQQDEAGKEKAAEKTGADKQENATEAAKPEAPKVPELSRKEKKKRCTQARQRLAKIESRGRLKATDDKGNVRHLTDDERAGRLKEARSDVAEYCR